MNPATVDTSSAAYTGMGLRKLAAQQQEVLDVVLGLQRQGRSDCSLTEIRDAYELRFSKRIDLNRISARVYDLVNAHRLVRAVDTRACTVSKKLIHPVYAPARQERLCA